MHVNSTLATDKPDKIYCLLHLSKHNSDYVTRSIYPGVIGRDDCAP